MNIDQWFSGKELVHIPWTGAFKTWSIVVPIAHIILVCLFRMIGLCPTKLKKGTRLSDMLAFSIVAFCCVTFLGLFGFAIFMKYLPGIDYDFLEANRFYGRSAIIEDLLVTPMIVYQYWDCIICLVTNDLRDPTMIMHHFVTGTLAYFCLAPYGHYWAPFFFGMVEITNIFLTGMEIFDFFPDYQKKYPLFHDACRGCFALGFYIIRLIMWPYIGYYFVTESLNLFYSNTGHSNFVILFYVFSCAFLSVLQVYWGYLIGCGIVSAIFPSKEDKKIK
jgi:hypothetical protein